VPENIRNDSLWRVEAYRLALFLADLGWQDVTKLMADGRTIRIADQLYRAAGSIGANIAEGYSRGTGKDRARFYEYALGSGRECRYWYFEARHVLGPDVTQHRLDLLSQIIRLLLTMVPNQRQSTLREDITSYDIYTLRQETTMSHQEIDSYPNPEANEDLHVSRFTSSRFTSSVDAESTLESGVVPRRGETVMVAGEGCWMIDSEGGRYLDLTASQGVAMLGYGHPVLSAAIADQAQRLHACPAFFYNDVRARFLEKLIEVTPAHMTHAFLTNSGAEAIDGAIKFARLATGRTRLIATRNGFHGRTIGAVSLTWNPKYREKFEPLLPEVTHINYGNLEELSAAVDENTAAVFLEAIQGEGGVNMASPDYWEGVQRLCRERGVLLVFDEIQTGFRTGKWFAHQHFGLEPDIMTLAKGLGAGFPMGAIVYTGQVQEALFSGAHGSTFGGNPLACAAGLATLETYQNENLIEQSAQMGALLRQKLEAAIGERAIVREIRGLGLMIGIDLRSKVIPFLKVLMEEHKILALPAGTTVLRLLPPLIISEDEIDLAVNAIAAVLPE
jgi:LysW-gamma-L-lysine/LysW-L-ornithine aminotransferase